MDKPVYRIERILELKAELAEFNSHPLKDVVLTLNGEPIVLSDAVLDQWRFCGLTNSSFVEMECYTPEGQADLTTVENLLLK